MDIDDTPVGCMVDTVFHGTPVGCAADGMLMVLICMSCSLQLMSYVVAWHYMEGRGNGSAGQHNFKMELR